MGRQDVAARVVLAAELEADQLVVWLLFELDGTEERLARLARQVGDAVREATGLPLACVHERFSSVEAERQLLSANVSRQRREEVIDQAAAAVILRAWLDHGDALAEPGSSRGGGAG